MPFVVEAVTSSAGVEEWRWLNSTSIKKNCSISDDDESLFVFSQSFMFYGLSIIVPFGLLSNFLSLIVFMTHPMRRRASSWHLAALSLSDSLSLLAIALDYWLKNDRVGLQWMRTSELTCIAVTHLSYTSRLLSAWLVTTFTVERFIGVVYPLQRSSLISVPLALRVIGFEALVCVLLSSFTLFTIGLVRDENSPSHYECDVRRERAQTYLICNVLFLIFGSIVIPILTIVTLNLAILKSFFDHDQNLSSTDSCHHHHHHNLKDIVSNQNRRIYHPHQKNGHTQTYHLHPANIHQQCISSPPPPTTLPPTSSPAPASPHPQHHQHHHQHHCRSIHSSTAVRRDITTVLIAVSATFVILNVPYCICWFSAFFLLNFRHVDLELSCAEHVTKLTLYAAKYISSVPYFLNYGLNFVLYSLCARSFRAQLWRTVTCEVTGRSKSRPRSFHHHPDSKTNGGTNVVDDVEMASSDRDVVHG